LDEVNQGGIYFSLKIISFSIKNPYFHPVYAGLFLPNI